MISFNIKHTKKLVKNLLLTSL